MEELKSTPTDKHQISIGGFVFEWSMENMNWIDPWDNTVVRKETLPELYECLNIAFNRKK